MLIALLVLHLSSGGLAESAEAVASSVGNQALLVQTPQGHGVLRLMADRPLDRRSPEVQRVLITIHGAHRNVQAYFQAAERVADLRGTARPATMVVAPDFPMQIDVAAFGLPADTLFWSESGWKRGLEAVAPAPISSYAALDTLIRHFANRAAYPALTEIVIAGHSAGGQVVQRYAVTNQVEDGLRRAGISLRYVVANPSSYLYFSNERPGPDGRFHPPDFRSCSSVAQWHHGLDHAPPYVGGRRARDLEKIYVARNVTYLLGMDDTDAGDALLDTSCAGMAQGPYRLARGLAYFAYLTSRHPGLLNHRVVQVPNVGHTEAGIYMSPCGVAVLAGDAVPSACPH